MDPRTLVFIVMGLACPIAMGLMMWMMNKNMSSRANRSTSDAQMPTSASERLAALYEQRQTLEAEIAELSRIAELETQRKDLVQGESPDAMDASPIAASEAN